jgi:hypothetical protein
MSKITAHMKEPREKGPLEGYWAVNFLGKMWRAFPDDDN